MKKETAFYIVYGLIGALVLTALVILGVFVSKELGGRLSYELKEVYTVDHILYFTVARGMLAGKKPYVDFYENKPPMIFLLSAISYKMRGDFYLLNVLCFISLIVMMLVPVALIIYKSIKLKADPLISVLIGAPVIASTLLLTMYSEARAGEAQVELFGATASLLAILCLFFSKENNKFYSPTVIISGFFLGIAAMFKEPHAVLVVVLSMLFVKNRHDLITKVLFPIIYALQTIFVILIISNCLDSYFTIYISNMFGKHINIYGSPYYRGFNFANLLTDMEKYSKYLPYIVGMLFAVSVVILTYEAIMEKELEPRIFKTVRIVMLFLSLYVAGFCVGLGGQYFNHHYVFAIPFYFSLIFLIVDEFPLEKVRFIYTKNFGDFDLKKVFYASIAMIIAIGSLSISAKAFTVNSKTYRQNTTVPVRVQEMKVLSKYVDDVCDALNEEHFLWVGFNGFHVYGYTKHLPYGPSFGQDKNNFQDPNGFFVTKFKEALEKTNIIIYFKNYTNSIKTYTDFYIMENFTTVIPEAAKNIKMPTTTNSKDYKVYFRGHQQIDPGITKEKAL